MHLCVQLLSYAEPAERLTATMDAWVANRVPEAVDHIEYWACVTPKQAVMAGHPDAARAHRQFQLVETPPGKLSSRNAAHDSAVAEGFDAFIACDADAPPLHEGVLEALVAPFTNFEVVAVNSTPTVSGGIGVLYDFIEEIENKIRPHVHGQTSLIETAAWTAVGPFDTSIDETDIYAVRAVEEVDLYWNLRQLGRVPRAPEARVLNDIRRIRCHLQRVRPGGPRSEFCKRQGTETFHPYDRSR